MENSPFSVVGTNWLVGGVRCAINLDETGAVGAEMNNGTPERQ